jgi:mannose-1-phosphate guanylyltransferase
MKAMVLAAGLGTRLRPLTNDRPKALVEVGGRTMLEIAVVRLRAFGIREVIVNVYHFADMIIDYLKAQDNFGIHIEISREEQLLDTGGGLKKAAWFLGGEGAMDEPFLVHNVDVVSTIDLARLVKEHTAQKALATLAVQQRETSRYLLFDGDAQLCGRRAGRDGEPELVGSGTNLHALAFCGVHAVSPRIFDLMIEEGAFPIVSAYLRLAGKGESIRAFRADEYYWRDLGKAESIARAAEELPVQHTQ